MTFIWTYMPCIFFYDVKMSTPKLQFKRFGKHFNCLFVHRYSLVITVV